MSHGAIVVENCHVAGELGDARGMKTSLLFLVLAACGSDSSNIDAKAGGGSDAKVFMDAPAALATCSDYCTTITSACTGAANSQYGSMVTCISSCSHFPVGTAGEQSGDSLQCRDYHAHAALVDPVTHCVHAGPSGGSVCGTPCQGFCDMAVAECPTQYPNAGGCATTCAGMTAGSAFNSSIQSGNNVSCRVYHATAASTDPGTHCPHIAAPSAAPCM